MILTGPQLRRRRRSHGMGDYADWSASLGLEACGTDTTVGDQYACSQRNDARIQAWAASPAQVAYQSRVAAAEAASVAAYGGSAAQFVQQFTANNPNVTPTTIQAATPPPPPPPPQPTKATVVNPSPSSQTTGSTLSTSSSGSAVSTANGATGTQGSSTDLISTVGGWITDLSGGPEWIAGVPNWLLAGGAGLALVMIFQASGKGR